MAQDQEKLRQAQTLSQTAKSPSNPANMAKMLGVAGEGIWDFLGQAYENLAPQSVEELALEGSPIGKAIGLIPPKYIKPFVERLKRIVLNDPATPYKDIVEEYIDRYPNVAAGLDSIQGYKRSDDPAGLLGYHRAVGVPANHPLRGPDGRLTDAHLRGQLDKGLGPFSGLLSRDEFGPRESQYIALNEAVLNDPNRATMLTGEKIGPREVLRHEMTHSAQHAWEPLSARQLQTKSIGGNDKLTIHESRFPELLKPSEIGARIAQKDIRQPLSMRLIDELNQPHMLTDMNPTRNKLLMENLNNRLRPQGMEVLSEDSALGPVYKMRKIVTGF